MSQRLVSGADPSSPRKAGALSVLADTVGQWAKSDAPTQSAALAFYTLFSMAPVLMVTVAIAGPMFGEEATRAEIERQVRNQVGPQVAASVHAVLLSAADPDTSRIAGTLGVLSLLIGATAVFVQLQEALNAIWEVQPRRGRLREFLRKRLISFGLVVTVLFLLLVSLVLSAGVAAAGAYMRSWLPLPATVFQAFDFVLFLALLSLLFASMYRLLPDAVITWRDVAVGGVVTALVFSLGKLLIGVWVAESGLASIYGVAGSLVLLLLWVYYTSMIVLLGAGFTRIYSRRYRPRGVIPEPGAVRHRHRGTS